MAPEQAMGEPIGPGTDLYATGAIAYELFTGRPPFGSSATPMAVLLRHVSEQAEPPIVHDPALDPRISDWIMRMLAKRPEDRPAGAEVAWEELEDIALDLLGPRWRRNARLLGDAAGKGSASPTASVVPVPVAPTITARTPPTLTSSTPPSTPPPPQPPPSRPPAEPPDRRRWLGVGAALVLLVTAAVAAFLVLGHDDSTDSGGASAASVDLDPDGHGRGEGSGPNTTPAFSGRCCRATARMSGCCAAATARRGARSPAWHPRTARSERNIRSRCR